MVIQEAWAQFVQEVKMQCTQEARAQFVQEVKIQCIQVALQLINELDKRFLVQEVLDAMKIIYPQ